MTRTYHGHGGAWPRGDFPVDAVNRFRRRARDGREWDMMTVSMPPGCRVDGFDLAGWKYTGFMSSRMIRDHEAGGLVSVVFRPDVPVRLWRVRGGRREQVDVTDPEGLCMAVRRAQQLTDTVDVAWSRDTTMRMLAAVTGFAPSRERQMILDDGGDRVVLYARTLVPMVSCLTDDMRLDGLMAVGRGAVARFLSRFEGRTIRATDWLQWLDPTGMANPLRAARTGVPMPLSDGVPRTAGGSRYEPLSYERHGDGSISMFPAADPADRWGRDTSMDVTLCEDGYYDNVEDSPDEHAHSRGELREYVAEADADGSPRPFDLASLVEDGETVADYRLVGDATNAGPIRYQCIIPCESTDISAALEDTLERIIADRADAGVDDANGVIRETMGAEHYDDTADTESGSIIDRGYALPSAIVSFDKRDTTSAMDPADPTNIATAGMDASGLTM